MERVVYLESILFDNTFQILNNDVSPEELEMLAIVSIMNSTQNFNVKGLKELLSKLNIKVPAVKLDEYMNRQKPSIPEQVPIYSPYEYDNRPIS